MYLVFDTETNGKPGNFKIPMKYVDNWPRITQLAWQLIDKDGNVIDERENLIKPNGWVIPSVSNLMEKGVREEDAIKQAQFFTDNNMSTERCEEFGKPISEELAHFMAAYNKANFLVAHNMSFDYNVLGAELIRIQMKAANGIRLGKICTMEASTKYCRLPGGFRGEYKWPQLIQLYKILFGEEFDGAHDALADVRACARCLIELVKKKIIVLDYYPAQQLSNG